MIVIINGPCGIGKTSVAWELNARFDRAVMRCAPTPTCGASTRNCYVKLTRAPSYAKMPGVEDYDDELRDTRP